MAFHVGQRVECVSDRWRWHRSVLFWRRWGLGRGPVRGGRYVVEAVCDFEDGQCLRLAGFRLAYSAHSFRPLVDGEFERLAAIVADPPKTLVRALQPAGVV